VLGLPLGIGLGFHCLTASQRGNPAETCGEKCLKRRLPRPLVTSFHVSIRPMHCSISHCIASNNCRQLHDSLLWDFTWRLISERAPAAAAAAICSSSSLLLSSLVSYLFLPGRHSIALGRWRLTPTEKIKNPKIKGIEWLSSPLQLSEPGWRNFTNPEPLPAHITI